MIRILFTNVAGSHLVSLLLNSFSSLNILGVRDFLSDDCCTDGNSSFKCNVIQPAGIGVVDGGCRPSRKLYMKPEMLHQMVNNPSIVPLLMSLPSGLKMIEKLESSFVLFF